MALSLRRCLIGMIYACLDRLGRIIEWSSHDMLGGRFNDGEFKINFDEIMIYDKRGEWFEKA